MKIIKTFLEKDAVGFKRFILFIRFIMSYIIILMIPLFFIGFFIYQSFCNMLYEDVQSAALATLSQTLDTVEMRLKEFNNIATQLSENNNLKPFLRQQEENITEYEYHKIMLECKNIRYINSFIDNLYIYFQDSDAIVSAEGKYNSSIFYKKVLTPKGMNKEEVINLFKNASNEPIRSIEVVGADGKFKEKVIYLKNIPIGENSKTTLMIVMNSEVINRLIKRVLGSYSGNTYILDEKGKVINYIKENEIELDKKELLSFVGQKQGEVYEKKIDGKNMLISYAKSQYTGWCSITIIDSEQILNRIYTFKGWILTVIILSIAVGIIVAYYFSYNTYNPIRRIAEHLYNYSAQKKEVNNFYKNELDMIEKVTSNIIINEKELQNSLDQYKPVVKEDVLLQILKGEFRDQYSVYETTKFAGLDLRGRAFGVIICNIDNSRNQKQEELKTIQGLNRFSVANVAAELCGETACAYTVDINKDRVAVIINFLDEEINYVQELQIIGENTRKFFQEHFDFTLTVGIGNVYSSMLDVSKSYLEAHTAMEYRMVKGDNTVIMFNDIVTGENERYFYTLQHEQTILEHLKKGNFKEIQMVLSSIIQNILQKPISMSMAQCIYFEIINTAMKSLSELEPEDYNKIICKSNVLPDLLKCKTIKELYGQTADFYRGICNCIIEERESKEEKISQEIILYVKEKFCDANLSLNYLSDVFSVTPSSLSRFFKNYTKQNFTDYLHLLRLSKAKRLLKETSKSIVDIAEECGYIDSHSLIRVFKKYEGITPGAFREMYSIK